MNGTNGSLPPFAKARTVSALICLGLVVILGLIDAVNPDFQLDSIQMGLLLGTSLLFLGIEAGRWFTR